MKRVLGNRKEERKADDDEELFSVGNPRSILSEADSDESVIRSESPVTALKRISKAIRALSETTKVRHFLLKKQYEIQNIVRTLCTVPYM